MAAVALLAALLLCATALSDAAPAWAARDKVEDAFGPAIPESVQAWMRAQTAQRGAFNTKAVERLEKVGFRNIVRMEYIDGVPIRKVLDEFHLVPEVQEMLLAWLEQKQVSSKVRLHIFGYHVESLATAYGGITPAHHTMPGEVKASHLTLPRSAWETGQIEACTPEGMAFEATRIDLLRFFMPRMLAVLQAETPPDFVAEMEKRKLSITEHVYKSVEDERRDARMREDLNHYMRTTGQHIDAMIARNMKGNSPQKDMMLSMAHAYKSNRALLEVPATFSPAARAALNALYHARDVPGVREQATYILEEGGGEPIFRMQMVQHLAEAARAMLRETEAAQKAVQDQGVQTRQ